MQHRLVLFLLVGLILSTAPAIHASTIVSLTGAGTVELSSDGAIYFDTSALELTSLTLSATSISVGSPLPDGVPDGFDSSLDLIDVAVLTDLFLDGDIYFEVFAFSGSVSFQAEEIYVTGAIAVDGPVFMEASTVDLANGISITGNAGSGSDCDSSSSLTLTAAIVVPGITCASIAAEDLTLGGIPTLPDNGGGIVVSSPVPEPGAALLFALGVGLLARWQQWGIRRGGW